MGIFLPEIKKTIFFLCISLIYKRIEVSQVMKTPQRLRERQRVGELCSGMRGSSYQPFASNKNAPKATGRRPLLGNEGQQLSALRK
jgi:hypothetical protein